MQSEIEKIIGGFISIIFLLIFFSAMIPVFQSLTGIDKKQTEIDKLNTENVDLKQQLTQREIEISKLQSLLESLDSTIDEKETTISNLSGQITAMKKEIEDLSQEIEGYREREYLPTINNNYYSILNNVERIENKFYTINLAIGLISITLFGMVIKMFGVDVGIKLFWQRLRDRKKPNNDNE